MTTPSFLSRLLCSSDYQALYARVRRIPLIGNFSHLLMSHALPKGTRITVPVRDGLGAGLQLTIDPRYEANYVDGTYEPALQKCLAANLWRGQVFYDIGAHIGFMSLVGARLIGAAGKVYAFEADPVNALRISHHAALNGLAQIDVIGSAVWSECTSLAFQRDSASSSGNRGVVVGVGPKGAIPEIVRVEATTVDAFVLEHLPPAVIKIDVEGAESEVLKGADRVTREVKPVVICEIHNNNAAEYASDWLAGRGYVWKWLEGTDSFPRHIFAKAASAPLDPV